MPLIKQTTTQVAEGTNLYYTQARFNTAFAAKSTTDLAEGTNLYYTAGRFDTAFAAKDTDDLAEGATNVYYTAARFDSAFAAKSTTDLAEGTNLYWTNARFDTRLAAASLAAANLTGIVPAANLSSANLITALGFTPEDSADKGVANGYASLGADAKIPASQLPAIAITDTFVVGSEAAMLALTAETGDVAVRTDESKSYILKGVDPSVLADWEELLSPTSPVQSVNGLTGAVVLTTSEITEGTNLYYTSARFDTAFAAKDTDDLAEGSTNLYYTDARADARIAADTNLARKNVTNDFTNVQNIIRTIAAVGGAVRLKNLDTTTAAGSGFQVNLGTTTGADTFAGAIFVTKDGAWTDGDLSTQDGKMNFYLALNGVSSNIANLTSAGVFTTAQFVGGGAGLTGVDAATLDGIDSTGFALAGHGHDANEIVVDTITGVTATDVQGALAEHQGDIDGLQSELDDTQAGIGLETDGSFSAVDYALSTYMTAATNMKEADLALDDALVAQDTRLDTIESGAVKVKTQAFAQLWAAGLLEAFEGVTVVDYYVNSGSAKTLGKIVISSDLSGSTGEIEIDILKKDTVGGSLTTLFTTVANPTLTANGGLTWTVVTGAGLPDVVSIPDGAVLVLQIVNAPADAENIKVELYEV